MKNLAVLMVILGTVAVVYGLFGLDRQQTVLEVGGFKATATEPSKAPVVPILGGIALVGGILLMAVSKRRPA